MDQYEVILLWGMGIGGVRWGRGNASKYPHDKLLTIVRK